MHPKSGRLLGKATLRRQTAPLRAAILASDNARRSLSGKCAPSMRF